MEATLLHRRSNIMNVFRTIRFKLTLWYSILLLGISLIFILSVNIIVANLINRQPAPELTVPRGPRIIIWENLEKENQELVQSYREHDLQSLRKISLLSILPLTFLSFAGGYFISGQLLKPLKNLNKSVSEVNANNLSRKIMFDDNGDEISELIRNFNMMIERLDNSFKSQKQFVENASHEIKTPLTVIKTNFDLALSDKNLKKENLLSMIETANKSVDFLNNLTEDLLLLSILENKIEKEKVDIIKIVKDSINQLEYIAEEKEIELALDDTTGKESIKLKINAHLIQRAVMNLLENAIKYSPKKSDIILELEDSEKEVIIRIKDKGDGISKAEYDKIFERFYRIDKSRSRQSGGTGLGLAITKKIITSHKGKIEVSSKKGKGSTFAIYLPK